MADQPTPYDHVKSWIMFLVGELLFYVLLLAKVLFALVLASTVAAKFGTPVRSIPIAHEYWLAAMAAAFYLFGGRP